MHRLIGAKAAYIESNFRRRLAGNDARARTDYGAAVVVTQGVRRILTAEKLHILKREVGVILDEDGSLIGANCSILDGDGAVLKKLETVGLGSRRTDCRPVDCVSVATEVEREIGSRLHRNAVARSIRGQHDSLGG